MLSSVSCRNPPQRDVSSRVPPLHSFLTRPNTKCIDKSDGRPHSFSQPFFFYVPTSSARFFFSPPALCRESISILHHNFHSSLKLDFSVQSVFSGRGPCCGVRFRFTARGNGADRGCNHFRLISLVCQLPFRFLGSQRQGQIAAFCATGGTGRLLGG